MLDTVLWRCRTLYNVALQQRKLWWERGQGIGASYYQQKAELPDLKAACPEFGAIHAHVLQDVMLRLDRAFQAFFRRVKAGETPGYPRFQGRGATTASPSPSMAMALSWMGASQSLQDWAYSHPAPSPAGGTPKTVTISREADGWYACISCADVPMQPFLPTGHETGIDLGIEAFATLSNGTASSILAGTARPSAHSRPRNAVSRAASRAATAAGRR